MYPWKILLSERLFGPISFGGQMFKHQNIYLKTGVERIVRIPEGGRIRFWKIL